MFHCRQSATGSSDFLAFGGIATFFSDHQTFFLGLLNIFLGPTNIFRLRLMSSQLWRSIHNSMTSVVRPFFGLLKYFHKFWKNNTLQQLLTFSNGECYFFMLLKIHYVVQNIITFPPLKKTTIIFKMCTKIAKHCVSSIERVSG